MNAAGQASPLSVMCNVIIWYIRHNRENSREDKLCREQHFYIPLLCPQLLRYVRANENLLLVSRKENGSQLSANWNLIPTTWAFGGISPRLGKWYKFRHRGTRVRARRASCTTHRSPTWTTDPCFAEELTSSARRWLRASSKSLLPVSALLCSNCAFTLCFFGEPRAPSAEPVSDFWFAFHRDWEMEREEHEYV